MMSFNAHEMHVDSVVSIKLQKVNNTSHAKIARSKLLELLIFG